MIEECSSVASGILADGGAGRRVGGERVARPKGDEGSSMTDAQDAPMRRLPRFSLITLIVVVNVAGVLLWANVRSNISVVGWYAFQLNKNVEVENERGWPFSYQRQSGTVLFMPDSTDWGEGNFSPLMLAYDSFLAFLMLGFAGFLTEFLVRRIRKAKRHDR